jgi:hypothetical protein
LRLASRRATKGLSSLVAFSGWNGSGEVELKVVVDAVDSLAIDPQPGRQGLGGGYKPAFTGSG